MNLNSWHYWGFALIALWMIVYGMEPNFGFVHMVTSEDVGSNTVKLLFLILGPLFLYKGQKVK